MTSNGWDLWREEVLSTLKELEIRVAKLEVKSTIWGLLGGLIPVLALLALYWLERKS